MNPNDLGPNCQTYHLLPSICSYVNPLLGYGDKRTQMTFQGHNTECAQQTQTVNSWIMNETEHLDTHHYENIPDNQIHCTHIALSWSSLQLVAC